MCQKELSQLPENSFWFSPFCFYKVLNQSELAHGGGELLASRLGGGTQGETVLLLAQRPWLVSGLLKSNMKNINN